MLGEYYSSFFYSPADESEGEQSESSESKDFGSTSLEADVPSSKGSASSRSNSSTRRPTSHPKSKRGKHARNKRPFRTRTEGKEPTPEAEQSSPTGSADKFLHSDYESDGLPQPNSKERRRKKQRENESRNSEANRAQLEADRRLYSGNFVTWSAACTAFFTDPAAPFPCPPTHGITKGSCIRGEQLGACHHDVEKTLNGCGSYSDRFLKRERLRWHPDHFSGKVQHQELAQKCSC